MIRLLIAALSAVIGALAVGLLFMLTGIPRTTFGWVWVVVIFLIGFVVARVCLSLGLNTSAAFERGAHEAAVEGRGDSFEATGRRAGAVVGKGLNKVARIGAPKPPVAPKAPPSDTSTAKPEVTVDKAARVIGSMVGRRVAQRRNKP
jgi:MFS family permease